jgi:S1-C subfamily serine protease
MLTSALVLGVETRVERLEHAPDLGDRVAALENAAPRGAILLAGTPEHYGSAVVVRCAPVLEGQPGYLVWLVTCAHVTEDMTSMPLWLGDRVLATASVDFVDEAQDIAVLTAVVQDPLPAFALGEDAVFGQQIVAWGYPGLGPLNLAGRQGIATNEGFGSSWLNPGASGGAVIALDGRLVGLIRAYAPRLSLGLYVPVSQVRAVLEQTDWLR